MSPAIRAAMTRDEVLAATWAAFLDDVPLTWLDRDHFE